jgi:hypothetical protein
MLVWRFRLAILVIGNPGLPPGFTSNSGGDPGWRSRLAIPVIGDPGLQVVTYASGSRFRVPCMEID